MLDKFFVFAIVFYGGYMLYHKTTRYNLFFVLLIVMTFTSCVYLYYYGYYVNDYCYHPDKRIGDKYHILLHVIGSFGHHLITFL